MTLNVLIVAGGFVALMAVAAILRQRRTRGRITTDQLSGDWLAQARSREDQPW